MNMIIINFFHRLLRPHCPECIAENERKMELSNHCDSCEILKAQLSLINHNNEVLLQQLIGLTGLREEIENPFPQQVSVPSQSKYIPWSVQRRQYEQEDRIKAHQIKEELFKKQEEMRMKNEELERSMGIVDEPVKQYAANESGVNGPKFD